MLELLEDRRLLAGSAGLPDDGVEMFTAGDGAPSSGIQVEATGRAAGTAGTPTVTLTADSISLLPDTSVGAGTGAVVLGPQTAGQFAGLHEGSVIASFLGSGLMAPTPYTGVDGNDGVLDEEWSPRIDVQLVALLTPSGSDAAAALPPSVTQIAAGATFYLEVWVQDVGAGTGVTGGRVTLTNPSAVAQAQTLSHGSVYTMFAGGTIDNPQRRVEDFGGGTLSGGYGVAPNWARLGYVQYVATAGGGIGFESAAGSLEFSLFGQGNVSPDDVNFGTCSLTSLPELSITGVTRPEGDSDQTDYEFTVALSHSSSQPVTVAYATQDGTATLADGDYLARNGMLTFAPGQTQQTISVAVRGDRNVENDETFSVLLSSPSGATIAQATAAGTITNDDSAVISIGDPSIVEGGALAFSVTISNPVDVSVTADRATQDGSATTADVDYTPLPSENVTLFAAGSTDAFTITVQTTADATVELNETLSLVLSTLGAAGRAVTFNGGGATLTGTGTITNDDAAVISIGAPSVAEGGVLAFSVTSSNPVDVAVTADRATDDGTATTADSDYTALASSNVQLFAAGSATASTITVQTTADAKVELNETLALILSNLSASGRAVTFNGGGATLTGTGTITNDDSAVISIGAPSVVEGGVLAFSVTISNPVDVALTADQATQDATATIADGDYTALPSENVTLFAAGSADAFTITVQSTADSKVELNETLSLILSNLSAGGRAVTFSDGGPTLGGTGTILDDDSAVITINDPSVAEGGVLAFVVTISSPVDAAVTADRATADGTATTGDNDYTPLAAANVTLFAAGSTAPLTINVQTTDDYRVELNETLSLILLNLSAGGRAVTFSGGGATLGGTGTILDDDSAVITISDPSVTEGGVLAFRVTISNPVDVAVTADRATNDATATTADADYTALASGNVQLFAAGSTAALTITVQTAADVKVELNETLELLLANIAAGGRAVTFNGDGDILTGTGTIINDDAAVISISDPDVLEGGVLAFSVTISNPVDSAVTADRATADGTATTADSDYTALASDNVQLFAAGSTAALTINVQTTNDAKVELDETLDVILSNLAAGGRAVTFSGAGAALTGTGTITNDDSAVISIGDPSVVEGGVLAFSVTISNPVDVAITADRATQDATATIADGDYTPLPSENVTLFAAGSADAFTITVQSTADSKVELDETLELILSNLAATGRAVTFSGAGAALTGTGTITNDDSAVISISDPSVAEGVVLTFSVTISNPVDVAVTADRETADRETADRETADGTATTADSDYTALASDNVQLFAAGSTAALTINVQTTADAKVELNETLELILSTLSATGRAVTFAGAGAALTGTGTITNDDSAVISISDPSVAEGGVLAFSVTISNPVDVAVTADRATAEGTATTADSDYTALASGNMELFAAGSTDAFTITVQTTADSKVELDEALSLILANLAAGGRAVTFAGAGATMTGTGTIINDDSAVISISDPSVVEGGSLAFSVTISNPIDVAVTADRATQDATATTADGDYTPLSSENVTLFAAGSTDAFTITVQTTADSKVELDETLSLILTNLAAGGRAVTLNGGGATLTGTGTIINDDSAVISISDPDVLEGGALAFSVTISNPVDVALTADRATQDATATTADGDYTPLSSETVTLFAAGSADAFTITVQTTADSTVELDETLSLILANLAATGREVTFSGGAATLTGTGTIINDDSAVISIAPASLGQVEGDTGIAGFVFRVSLSAPSALPVTVRVDTADGTATSADNDYQPIENLVLTFFTPGQPLEQTVTVNVVGDTRAEGNETFLVNLSQASWGGAPDDRISLGSVQAGGTILNDDPLVSVQVVAVRTPSATGSTALPSGLELITLGNTYYVEVWVQDRLAPEVGISGGWLDLGYTTAVADVVQVVNLDFDQFSDGTIDAANGMVEDLGGGTLQAGMGIAPAWVRLGYVAVVAAGYGQATFDLSPGSLPFGRYGAGNVAWSQVDLGTSLMVDQIAHPWQNLVHPCDVNEDGMITAQDVLVAINEINSNNARELPVPPQSPRLPPPFFDVSGDDWLTAQDVLVVINYINAHGTGPVPDTSSSAPSIATDGLGTVANGAGEGSEKEAGPAHTVARPPHTGSFRGTIASPATDRERAVDETFAQLGSQSNEAHARQAATWLADAGRESSRGERLPRLPSRREPRDDVLARLAEQALDRLLDDVLEPQDALFA